MLLSDVTIRNFKGIKERQIEFKQGFNLIKGVNGTGKTSILEAIAVGLGAYVAGVGGVKSRHFSGNEIRQVYEKIGDGSYTGRYETPVEVCLQAKVGGEQFEWIRSRNSAQASRSTIQPRDICKKAEKMANDIDVELPILAYLGAGRVWSQKKEKTENIFRKQYFRTVGYTDSLSEASNTKLLLNWCAKMDQIAWQKEMKIAEYEAVKKAVADFMDYMESDTGHTVFYDKQSEELLYSRQGLAQPIRQLSAGYHSLIWMVFDIAYRMAILNPMKKGKIAETHGVVLIDEIDMHLHPKWQWNIIDALRTVFPNVQFIAATHSPILFASAPNVWLVDVEQEQIEYSLSHYGIDVNTAMARYQDTNEMPQKIEEKVTAFYNAMEAEEYVQAKILLEQLEMNTAPEHPLLVELRTKYEFETTDWEA